MPGKKKAPGTHDGPQPPLKSGPGAVQDALWQYPDDMLELETRLLALGHVNIAGLDEAGRGPLAGPVTAAAVILPPGERYQGLTDSKLLSPEARERWYEHICTHAIAYSVAVVSEREIEELNILVASRKAMETALDTLSVNPGHILVDGIVPLETPVPQLCVKKGDRRSQSIAAASVLAKVTRDRLMVSWHDDFPQYNFKKNKGYGTQEHREAIRKFGVSPIHRRTFRGVKEYCGAEAGPVDAPLFSPAPENGDNG